MTAWVRRALLAATALVAFVFIVWITQSIHRSLEFDRCRHLGTWSEFGTMCIVPWVGPKTQT